MQFIAHFEPITLLSALAMVTEHIGLIATMSMSYNEPYHVARRIRFARPHQRRTFGVGTGIVTSVRQSAVIGGMNFNRTEPFGHHERYKRAHEFAEVRHGPVG